MKDDDGYRPDEGLTVAVEDKAFIESKEHSLNGLKLHAYSPERMWAADAIGLRWGRLTREQNEQFGEDGTYPGMAGDVPIVIWVCSLDNREEWLSARRNPSGATAKVERFAIANKIVSPKQESWWSAYEVFKAIMREFHVSYGEPAEKKTEQLTTT